MGVVGCGGTGGHKNNTNRVKNGRKGRCFGAMAGGNFPEHHVLRCQSKSGADGCWRVKMGSYACVGTYLQWGTGKNGETKQKSGIRACFAGVVVSNKTACSWQGWSGGERGFLGARKTEQRVFAICSYIN